MKETQDIEKSPLRALFWREEILQVLYWMDGEGFGQQVAPRHMLAFLQTNPENLRYHVEKLIAAGYLEKQGESLDEDAPVSLSAMGKKEAGRHFADAFQGMQKAGHGECGPDCEFCYGADGAKLDNCVHHCASQNG